MKRICIIEDDDYKMRDLRAFIEEECMGSRIEEATSYRAGSKLLKDQTWDLVLLDMRLPLYAGEGDKFFIFGGERMLRHLERSNNDSNVIVVTQYTTFSEHLDEVDFSGLVSRLHEQCPRTFRGAIQYSVARRDWREQLKTLIQDIFR
jgi:DNA-binding NtrC family response regulator